MWTDTQAFDWVTVVYGAGLTMAFAAVSGVILALGQILAFQSLPVSKTAWGTSTVIGCVGVGLIVYCTWWLWAVNTNTARLDTGEAAFAALMLVSGFLQGIVLGVLQWQVLQRSYEESGIWIGATAVGWCMFFAVPIVGYSMVRASMVSTGSTNTALDGIIFVAASIAYVCSTAFALHSIGNAQPRTISTGIEQTR
jgi:hypothetical protein